MKMDQKEYIILCLEDSNDWSNATTRRLVMQARPGICRCVLTVLVLAAVGQHQQQRRRQQQLQQSEPMQRVEERDPVPCMQSPQNAPPIHTREQVDPTLSRTVVVSTKLDTRIPQFARPQVQRRPSNLLACHSMGTRWWMTGSMRQWHEGVVSPSRGLPSLPIPSAPLHFAHPSCAPLPGCGDVPAPARAPSGAHHAWRQPLLHVRGAGPLGETAG